MTLTEKGPSPGGVHSGKPRAVARRQPGLIADTILLGVVGGLSAPLFLLMLRTAEHLFLNLIAGYYPPELPSEGGALVQHVGAHGLWLLPAVTALGGLITGILVYVFAPEAEGHGTDAVVRSFHDSAGYVRPPVPAVKLIASAISLGSGGAGGREGPTALISSGFASVYATLSKRTEEDRRLLLLVGMASGLSAIFRSPVGTAVFAVEVLYGGMEFEAGALAYTTLGSIVAYGTSGLFVGWTPLFHVPGGFVVSGSDYAWYLVLGGLAGLLAGVVPQVFYTARDLFKALPAPRIVRPAIGGLAVGLIASRLPQVVSGGYGWIQLAINGQLTMGLMAVLVAAQLAAFSLTISSGGSAGVFEPTLFMGTMLGGFVARMGGLPIAPFAVVGMASVFAGAARVPLATLLMVAEMTGGYSLLVPSALSVMASYLIEEAVSSRLKYRSLYQTQVPGPSESPVHALDYLRKALRLLSERHVSVPAGIGALDLHAVLASGFAVELGDGKRLLLSRVAAGGPLAGRPLRANFPAGEDTKAEAVLVLRAGHTLWPRADLVAEPGDELLVIESGPRRQESGGH
jgi:CIC family chloride channel protein